MGVYLLLFHKTEKMKLKSSSNSIKEDERQYNSVEIFF